MGQPMNDGKPDGAASAVERLVGQLRSLQCFGSEHFILLEQAADALDEQASRIDLLHSWEADAKARSGILEQHLRNVLEVARTWQPEYATKMDRDTLQYAQECADCKVSNASFSRGAEAAGRSESAASES